MSFADIPYRLGQPIERPAAGLLNGAELCRPVLADGQTHDGSVYCCRADYLDITGEIDVIECRCIIE